MMKKQDLSMRLHSNQSVADDDTHNIDAKTDSTKQHMLPCYICGKSYHSVKVNFIEYIL